ncbi:MAG: hypothetical protein AB1529_06580 [Candidatus Micrarchaeota archaeon]
MEDEAKASGLEAETQKKVSDSLSKIEAALAYWDAAKKKPRRLVRRIAYLKMSHELLSGWEKESLKGSRDFSSVLTRLGKFADICERLERARARLEAG